MGHYPQRRWRRSGNNRRSTRGNRLAFWLVRFVVFGEEEKSLGRWMVFFLVRCPGVPLFGWCPGSGWKVVRPGEIVVWMSKSERDGTPREFQEFKSPICRGEEKTSREAGRGFKPTRRPLRRAWRARSAPPRGRASRCKAGGGRSASRAPRTNASRCTGGGRRSEPQERLRSNENQDRVRRRGR